MQLSEAGVLSADGGAERLDCVGQRGDVGRVAQRSLADGFLDGAAVEGDGIIAPCHDLPAELVDGGFEVETVRRHVGGEGVVGAGARRGARFGLLLDGGAKGDQTPVGVRDASGHLVECVVKLAAELVELILQGVSHALERRSEFDLFVGLIGSVDRRRDRVDGGGVASRWLIEEAFELGGEVVGRRADPASVCDGADTL